jgi:hypothetical protein
VRDSYADEEDTSAKARTGTRGGDAGEERRGI